MESGRAGIEGYGIWGALVSDPLIPIPVVDPLRLAWYELNDFGNARRLSALSGGLLKWVDDAYWIAFDDRRWSRREGDFRARSLAHRVAQHLHDEAAALGEIVGNPNEPDRAAIKAQWDGKIPVEIAVERLSALHKHAVKTGDANRTTNMLKQAQDLPEMRAWSEEFDVDPLAYNVLNGTLRFQRGEDGVWRVAWQRGHAPGDLISQLANVEYDPDADCPQWRDRLKELQPDADVRMALSLMYGQTLTGLTDGEEFYTCQGQGGDGKSKTHEILADLHGDYYRHSPVKTWLAASFQKSGSEHRSDLVRLAGDIRFLVSEEPPPNSKWDSEILKQATGGGSITARGSGAATEITFKPRFKIFVEVNKLPAAPSDDRGWWRRQLIVPWPVNIADLPGGMEPPAELVARLLPEKPGILNWLVAGCLEWLAVRKVPKVERIQRAIDSARAGTSPVAEWLSECCDLSDPDAREGSTKLWKHYEQWCEANGIEKPGGQTKFGRSLTDRQLYDGPKDSKGLKTRLGIKLRDSDPLLNGSAGAGGNEGGAKPPPRAQGDPGAMPDDYSPPDGDHDPFGD